MDETNVLEAVGQPGRTTRPAFDLLASKLRPPRLRPGTVCRSSLVEKLAREDLRPVVSVVAPAGYGKTTLLAQWAERDGRTFAWVSVDERDNDPKVLLSYIAEALDRVQPVGRRVFAALASPASSVPGSVVPRLGSAFASMTAPVALVLDDVHLLRDSECRSALSVLADHVPAGSRLVLAGRTEPPVRIARLRAEGRILEIGRADLSLTRKEAARLLREADVVLDEDDVAELHRRTEGWAVGLYLAALALREGGSLGSAAASFAGDDQLVSEYVESEFLARIPRRHRVFLTRAAVLERMCGALCEAVLELPGSAATLAELARSNLLLVPLDRRGQWYRYHHLFRDMLLAELERREPGQIPVLRHRAAQWCAQNSLPEQALEYSMAAGDVDSAARLIGELAAPARRQGRLSTLRRWFGWLDERGGIDGHLTVTALAAVIYAWMGQPVEAERWADVMDRWQEGAAARCEDPAASAWAALARAFTCRHGIAQMLADADDAVARFSAAGIVTPGPALIQGVARVLSGDLDGGDAALTDAASLGEETGAPEIVAQALGERALVAMAHHEWDRAEVLAREARTVVSQAGIEESHVTPLVNAAQARTAIHRGEVASARQALVSAQRGRPLLTYALPHMAVQARIELIRGHIALADLAGARTLMREIEGILRRRPDLGTLVGETQALRTRLASERRPGGSGASSLTTAELRVLPMLATHMSAPEIAAELFVSQHTIKSQQMSLYRKLAVSSRSQAVTRARELGLLES